MNFCVLKFICYELLTRRSPFCTDDPPKAHTEVHTYHPRPQPSLKKVSLVPWSARGSACVRARGRPHARVGSGTRARGSPDAAAPRARPGSRASARPCADARGCVRGSALPRLAGCVRACLRARARACVGFPGLSRVRARVPWSARGSACVRARGRPRARVGSGTRARGSPDVP